MGYWWPEEHIVGYDVTFAHQIHDWIAAIAGGHAAKPDFVDGLRCQEVVEAISLSAKEFRTVAVTYGNY